MRCIQLLGRYTHDRFLRHFESEIGLAFQDGLLELTALRRVHYDKVRARAPVDSEIEYNIREEFKRLLTDLKVQIVERQSTFAGIKRIVLDSIAARIKAANSVTLEMNPSESHETRGPISDWNNDLVSGLKSDNLGLSQMLSKMRILRCLGKISTVRASKKRLAAAENDRKQTHSLFWSNRLTYESTESRLETQLAASRKRLAETEIEIERVKQQLEIEKANNRQLVTWKAKNLRTVDNLREQLEAFTSIGDANIAQLLQQLSARHTELDELREDAREFEELVRQDVHGQLGEASRVRDRIQRTRRAKSELREFLNAPRVGDIRHSYDLSEVKVENRQLRRENQALAEEVQKLEDQKDRRPAMVRGFMEATFAPPVPVIHSRAKPPGIIIRPLVPGHPLAKMLRST
jgi:DNA repair exonuclease SbcCD ATPase subunit